ncbi:TPA: EscF/YscF/HrpA family type III secretion system needle major subunit [Proteus mirabilis]|uniref:EscF/YscF/HrpA family type III secretion system needle major subunit n=1 Tax=Proteus mirabilis TaxID=584 RepID=UPI000307DEA1|nr:EscF/YscF/HrpA family type III secretion system needle major subunit [Proteus mirabilis]HCT2534119.1 EscF/YscF/HrpA family type III secretion system needle major subunit [Proteus mirabilis]HEK1971294.1 EscF/YscF/HrpA family type III secretion system needle major subunit [Proteus mirabilis]
MAASLVETDVSSISKVDQYFHKPVKTQSYELSEALKADTSNAAALAEYQAKLAEYNITRNAQSTSIKVIKDLAMSIIGNMR